MSAHEAAKGIVNDARTSIEEAQGVNEGNATLINLIQEAISSVVEEYPNNEPAQAVIESLASAKEKVQEANGALGQAISNCSEALALLDQAG